MLEQTTPNVIPNQETDRAAWLRWRKGGIGGSDAAAILGESQYASPLDIYIDKTSEFITDESNLACERGLALEPHVAARYVQETGRRVRRQQSRIHPKHSFLRCSMDYQIIADDTNPTGLLECKTANSWVFNSMKLNGIHTAYWIQVQHNMMVCGYTWGAIAILQPDSWEFLHFDIKRDDDFCATLLEREVEFWGLVQAGTPPLSEAGKLPTLPTVGGELVKVESLDHSMALKFQDLTSTLAIASEIKAEADALHDQAKAATQAWMLANNIDVIEGFGCRVYYKEQAGRTSFDKKALAAAHPTIDLSAFDKQGAPFRTFRVFKTEAPVPAAGQLTQGVQS